MIKEQQFVVKEDYISLRLLCKGTLATCVRWTDEIVMMRIDNPTGNSDVVPGEEVLVTREDFWGLWTASTPISVPTGVSTSEEVPNG